MGLSARSDSLETPPTSFALRGGDTLLSETRTAVSTESLLPVVIEGFWDEWTSSSRRGSIQSLARAAVGASSITQARSNVAAFLNDYLRATKRADDVQKARASQNVYEIRRLTGFTWERLADLLNVDRRTLTNWVNGSEIRETNREHIARVLSVIRFADRGNAKENASLLEHCSLGVSPFEAIKAKEYSRAQEYLGVGVSRSFASSGESDWIGEYAAYSIHPDADGSEQLEELPEESQKKYRKRSISRT